MSTQTNRRFFVVWITLLWAVAEWLLFELRRAPYRPPEDMRTFLGAERDGVFLLMTGLAIGWGFLLIVSCRRSAFNRTDYIRFGLFLTILMAIFGLLVIFPAWPVTPNELLWS